jgi:hypothetical protein
MPVVLSKLSFELDHVFSYRTFSPLHQHLTFCVCTIATCLSGIIYDSFRIIIILFKFYVPLATHGLLPSRIKSLLSKALPAIASVVV